MTTDTAELDDTDTDLPSGASATRDANGLTETAMRVLRMLQAGKRGPEITTELGFSKQRLTQYRKRLVAAGYDITNPDQVVDPLDSIRRRDTRHFEAEGGVLPFGATSDRHRLISHIDDALSELDVLESLLTRTPKAVAAKLEDVRTALRGRPDDDDE